MNDISKIVLPDGGEYEIKDKKSRDDLSDLLNKLSDLNDSTPLEAEDPSALQGWLIQIWNQVFNQPVNENNWELVNDDFNSLDRYTYSDRGCNKYGGVYNITYNRSLYSSGAFIAFGGDEVSVQIVIFKSDDVYKVIYRAFDWNNAPSSKWSEWQEFGGGSGGDTSALEEKFNNLNDNEPPSVQNKSVLQTWLTGLLTSVGELINEFVDLRQNLNNLNDKDPISAQNKSVLQTWLTGLFEGVSLQDTSIGRLTDNLNQLTTKIPTTVTSPNVLQEWLSNIVANPLSIEENKRTELQNAVAYLLQNSDMPVDPNEWQYTEEVPFSQLDNYYDNRYGGVYGVKYNGQSYNGNYISISGRTNHSQFIIVNVNDLNKTVLLARTYDLGLSPTWSEWTEIGGSGGDLSEIIDELNRIKNSILPIDRTIDFEWDGNTSGLVQASGTLTSSESWYSKPSFSYYKVFDDVITADIVTKRSGEAIGQLIQGSASSIKVTGMEKDVSMTPTTVNDTLNVYYEKSLFYVPLASVISVSQVPATYTENGFAGTITFNEAGTYLLRTTQSGSDYRVSYLHADITTYDKATMGNVFAETTDHKVTEINENSTDKQYPTAKAVYNTMTATAQAAMEEIQGMLGNIGGGSGDTSALEAKLNNIADNIPTEVENKTVLQEWLSEIFTQSGSAIEELMRKVKELEENSGGEGSVDVEDIKIELQELQKKFSKLNDNPPHMLGEDEQSPLQSWLMGIFTASQDTINELIARVDGLEKNPGGGDGGNNPFEAKPITSSQVDNADLGISIITDDYIVDFGNRTVSVHCPILETIGTSNYKVQKLYSPESAGEFYMRSFHYDAEPQWEYWMFYSQTFLDE